MRRRLWLAVVLACGVLPGLAAGFAGGPSPLPGFPVGPVTGPVEAGALGAFDLDGDGDLELIAGDSGACIWIWERDGTLWPQAPLRTDPTCDGPARISAPLAFGDITGDGQPEIVAGTLGVGPLPNQRGELWAWDASGAVVAGWPREMGWSDDAAGEPFISGVALAELGGGPGLEVMYTTSNNAANGQVGQDIANNAYARNGAGELLPIWPTWAGIAGIRGMPAAGDISCDSRADMVTGRDHNYLHAYGHDARQLLGWPLRTFVHTATQTLPIAFPRSAPVIGDLDSDGRAEIIALGEARGAGGERLGDALLVVDSLGRRKPGWEIAPTVPGAEIVAPVQAPALGDLDGDGRLEIVAVFADGSVRAYGHDGGLRWAQSLGAGLLAAEPLIGDISGDGQPEVIIAVASSDGLAGGLQVLSGAGQPLPGLEIALQGDGIRATPLLADLDNDGDSELSALSVAGALHVWQTAGQSGAWAWPTARLDPARSGAIGWELGSGVIVGSVRIYLPLISDC